MQAFVQLSGKAALLASANIDTDVIMPKQFLKGVDREGLARGLFHDLRFSSEGLPDPGFVLNEPAMAGVSILVTGPNFGCGSSREHAVWGLLQYGVRAIVGTTFGAIFADNAANNGLLLIGLDAQRLAQVSRHVEGGRGALSIDLQRQLISGDDLEVAFTVEPSVRRLLMLGLDRIGETLAQADRIRAFEAGYFADHPWLASGAAS